MPDTTWPWVSRGTLDAERANHAREVGAMRTDLDAERARHDHLLAQFTTLRLAGAVEVAPPTVTTSSAATFHVEPDELKALIDVKSNGNLRLRKMMLRQLGADRSSGMSDDEIRTHIEQGVGGDGVPA